MEEVWLMMWTCMVKRTAERSPRHVEVANLECRLLERGWNMRPLTYHIVVGVSIASAGKVQNMDTRQLLGLMPKMECLG